jgi:hypothetical protein
MRFVSGSSFVPATRAGDPDAYRPRGASGFSFCIREYGQMTTPTAMASLTAFNSGVLKRTDEMSQSWLERIREFRQIERDFGSRLLTARNTSEAVTICNEWMAKRLLALASEQQIVATAWFELISDAMKAAALSRGPDQKTTP